MMEHYHNVNPEELGFKLAHNPITSSDLDGFNIMNGINVITDTQYNELTGIQATFRSLMRPEEPEQYPHSGASSTTSEQTRNLTPSKVKQYIEESSAKSRDHFRLNDQFLDRNLTADDWQKIVTSYTTSNPWVKHLYSDVKIKNYHSAVYIIEFSSSLIRIFEKRDDSLARISTKKVKNVLENIQDPNIKKRLLRIFNKHAENLEIFELPPSSSEPISPNLTETTSKVDKRFKKDMFHRFARLMDPTPQGSQFTGGNFSGVQGGITQNQSVNVLYDFQHGVDQLNEKILIQARVARGIMESLGDFINRQNQLPVDMEQLKKNLYTPFIPPEKINTLAIKPIITAVLTGGAILALGISLGNDLVSLKTTEYARSFGEYEAKRDLLNTNQSRNKWLDPVFKNQHDLDFTKNNLTMPLKPMLVDDTGDQYKYRRDVAYTKTIKKYAAVKQRSFYLDSLDMIRPQQSDISVISIGGKCLAFLPTIVTNILGMRGIFKQHQKNRINSNLNQIMKYSSWLNTSHQNLQAFYKIFCTIKGDKNEFVGKIDELKSTIDMMNNQAEQFDFESKKMAHPTTAISLNKLHLHGLNSLMNDIDSKTEQLKKFNFSERDFTDLVKFVMAHQQQFLALEEDSATKTVEIPQNIQPTLTEPLSLQNAIERARSFDEQIGKRATVTRNYGIDRLAKIS